VGCPRKLQKLAILVERLLRIQTIGRAMSAMGRQVSPKRHYAVSMPTLTSTEMKNWWCRVTGPELSSVCRVAGANYCWMPHCQSCISLAFQPEAADVEMEGHWITLGIRRKCGVQERCFLRMNMQVHLPSTAQGWKSDSVAGEMKYVGGARERKVQLLYRLFGR
jgi:hypothetical protein